MNKLSINLVVLLLIITALSLSACQPNSIPVAFTETIIPVEKLSVVVPTSSPQPDYQVQWSYQTEGAVWGTPTISDGILYFGSDDHNLYALDSRNGNLEWTFTTEGLVRSQPAVANGVVYFASDDGYLYAVDTQGGRKVWQTDIGDYSESEKRENPGTIPDPTTFDYLQSSPIVYDQMIYVGSADGKAYALSTDDGKIAWTFTTGQKIRADPTVAGDTVYMGSWDGKVYALDVKSGEARWATPIGGQIQTTALVADGLVYTASRKASVVALNAQTGAKVWEFDYGNNMWVESSPTLAGDNIYIGSSASQYLLGLDRRTGKVRDSYIGNVFMWGRPISTDHIVYVGATSAKGLASKGGLLALEIPEISPGPKVTQIQLKWYYPTGDTLMPDGIWNGVASSPILVGDTLYFGSLDGKMYAVSPSS